MLDDSPGVHHVTSIVGDPQRNVDFYADVLGLRLVKRTVNYEDMLRYHLYYGNETGDLGTLLTCFPYPNDVPGRLGKPQISGVSFAIPPGSVPYWTDRLDARGVDVTGPRRRFDETVLRFEDDAGTPVELVTADSPVKPWTGGSVPADAAIRGVHGVTLLPTNPYTTAGTLETLGFDLAGEERDGDVNRIRYRASGDHATVVDVLDRSASFGREGIGTIHHVAVRVASEEQLYEWHDLFRERDYDVSRVRDRHYFHSLYVREPGGILFELATESPGLTADEDPATLGESLVLPDWFEEDRDLIERQLPPVELPRRNESE
ncbi:VOC family protein [Halorussus sp. MSC15.2]|uniref:VOC family protein n=1 Tax=Halorussus sp. MSC15.2 TaxID=2283638 RepID=UPI0013CFBA5E|nr:VOC family protein [Halorussus sp. MSC15.2]NEU58296.1 ring-cleaving dioxygenase [Halorussus sp. MSC15.2]